MKRLLEKGFAKSPVKRTGYLDLDLIDSFQMRDLKRTVSCCPISSTRACVEEAIFD
jgi:hypothetical protein